MYKKRGPSRQTGDGCSMLMSIVIAVTLALGVLGMMTFLRQGDITDALELAKSRVGDLEALAAQIRTDISARADDVLGLKSTFTTMDQTVDGLESDSMTAGQRVSHIESQLDLFEQQVDGFPSNLSSVDLWVNSTKDPLGDVPAVLIDWWGGSWNPIEHHRMFAYNRLNGKATIIGPKRDALKLATHPQDPGATFTQGIFYVLVQRDPTAFWATPGYLPRLLMQIGYGTSKQQPIYMSNAFNTDGCRLPVILRPHPENRIYITKTGLPPVDRSDPNEYYSRPFNGTGVMYLDITGVYVGIGRPDVEDTFNTFGVPFSSSIGVVSVDMSWFIDELFVPVPLSLDAESYEGNYTPLC